MKLLHVALTLSLPFLLLSLLGCPRAKVEKAALGPEVTADDVDLAFSKAIAGRTTRFIRKGQWVEYAITRRVENNDTVTELERANVEVLGLDERKSVNGRVVWIGVLRRRVLGDDGIPKDLDPVSVSIEGTPAGVTPSQVILATHARQVVGPQEDDVPRTYHNLREGSAMIEPPRRVKDDTDCGGLSECQIPARYLSFDVVFWFKDGTRRKLRQDFTFSPATPYLPYGQGFDLLNGLLLQHCGSLYVPVSGRNVYVRDCQTLDDFKK